MIIYSHKSIAYIMRKHARRAQFKIKCTSTKFCNAIPALNLATFMLLSNRNNNKKKSGNTTHLR